MSDDSPPHKRRVRYAGTHPRKFGEKYKELNPERYAEDVEKVKQRGQTPAGSHRPICVAEILETLDPKPGMRGIDCTLGYGGHGGELLARLSPGGYLLGLDVDSSELPKTEARLRAAGYDKAAFSAKLCNFSRISECMDDFPDGCDFVLADLGVSSMQLDTPERGFSFKNPAPLDLRLDASAGETAAELIRRASEEYLFELLVENSDEPHAKALAKAMAANREGCATTDGLANVLSAALLKKGLTQEEMKPSIQRTFQALRIAVNDEFGSLERLLEALPRCLKSGGKVAILTFHSGEDRRVKKAFKEFAAAGIFSECVRRPLRPSAQERHDNPRSSCAKLRWAQKA